MAKIPTGNFGSAIAQPGQAARVPQGAFDESGLARAGAAAMHTASEAINDSMTLERAKAANAVLDREISVKTIAQTLSEEIASGAIHYDDAKSEYQRRIGDLGGPNMSGIDPVTAENLSKGFKRADFVGENAISSAVKSARVLDYKTQTEGILDKLGKQAGMPGADVEKLNAQVDSLDEIGAQAYGPAWAKRKQDWKDNNWNDQLSQRAIAVRDDLKGINDLQKQIASGEYAEKLDSNKRNTLVARLDGYKTSLIQRQEAAAARAERAQERYLKRAEAEFKTFTEITDKGTIIAPDYVDRVMKLTSGTPYQTGVIAMTKQAQETGGIAAQPIATQQAALDQIDSQIAKHGRTPALDKRREQIDKVLRGSQADLKENGLRAGLERGVITELAPLDVSSPQGFAASIEKRLEQAQTVGLWAGKSVSPLDAKEAEQVRAMLDALPPKQKSQAVATLAESVGPRAASAIAEQMDSKDKALALAFAMAGGKTPAQTGWFGRQIADERYTSELILKGATAIKDGTAMKDGKALTGWKATIATQVDGAFSDEKTSTKVKDAAYYITAGIAAENGGSVNPNEIKRAVRLAIGGDIIERNGKKLPVPDGMDEDALDKRLRAVTADDIARQAPDGKVIVAGAEMSTEAFAKSVPGQELLYAGPGRYAVIVRGRPVVNAAGKPVIIGVQ